MQEKNKIKKKVPDPELERQRMIDKGGTQTYGSKDKDKNKDKNKNKTKDDNILIDSEH
jgi:hypothetical protein